MLSIKQRQLNLRFYFYYYKGEIDGIEGELSKQAYRSFQSENGLVVDGIYGKNTEAKLLSCIKSIQTLLNLNGYNLVIDGLVGDKTLYATVDFQSKNGLVVDKIVGSKTLEKLNQKLSNEKYECKYFKDSEFTCECGCGLNLEKDGIKKIADEIREHFGRPMIITSGTRCVKHNREVGGVQGSYHTTGNAIDFVIPGVNVKEYADFCKQLVKQGKARYTYYGTAQMGNAVHIDTGGLE